MMAMKSSQEWVDLKKMNDLPTHKRPTLICKSSQRKDEKRLEGGQSPPREESAGEGETVL